jgi:hypothetical protein
LYFTEPDRLISAIVNIVSYVDSVFGKLKKQTLSRLMLVAGCWLLVAGTISIGQTNYYSKTTGNLELLASWGINPDGSGTLPANFTSANQIFNIRNNATPTIGANWTVSGAGSKVILGDGTAACVFTIPGTFIFTSSCDVSNNGTLKITSAAVTPYSGTLIVLTGGTYEHAVDGGIIPTATWNAGSNCNITGIIASTGFTGGLGGQTFGNFTWNCPAQTSNFYLASSFTVSGNLSVLGTGAFNHNLHSLRMSTSGTGYTIVVGGNFVVGNTSSFLMNNSIASCFLNVAGDFTINTGSYFVIVSGNANSTLSVAGNVNILGTLDMQEENSRIGTLNAGGNFTIGSSGMIQETATGSGVINFNGSGIQTYSRTGGTILNTINFAVISGSILNVGTSVIDGSDGTFTLNSNAGIITAHPQGLSTIAGTGSIQVTGAKSFNTGADYTYNGTPAQVSGNALTTARNLTVNNSNGLTLSNAVTVTGSLNLALGIVTTGANTMYLSNGTAGSLTYGASSFVNGNLERAINSVSTDYYFPVGVTQRQMAKFNFANLTNGSLRVSFQASDPGGNGLPVFDSDNQIIKYEFTNGFWTALAQNSLSSNNYSLTLDAVGFNNPGNINSSTRVIKRTGSGAWTIDGTHGPAVGTVLDRVGCNGIDNTSGTQFGAGTGNCFIFTGQPGSVTRCVGGSASFSVAISGGLGAITYQWYKNGGILSDGGNISGATTNNLSVSNLTASDEASYYCLVTDNCSSQSSQTAIINIPRPAAALGYKFQKSFTIDHTKVIGGSDLINFPLLIKIVASPELRNVPLGHVENTNGYDIIFTDENYNILDHQVESYTAANGDLIVWVRIPVLSASANTTVLMLYGNPQITADPSVKTVWNPSYQGVWHMDDNPAGIAPQLRDAAQTNDGTSHGGMLNGDLVAGNIGNAIHFDGNNDFFDLGTGIIPATNFTEECWIKVGNQSDGSYHGLLGYDDGNGDFKRAPSLYIVYQNRIHAGFGDNNDWCSWQTPGSVIINDNSTWNHLVTTFNGQDYKLYVNGTEVFSDPEWAGRIPYNTPIRNIGRVDYYFTGAIDEVRVLSKALTSGWISTEYGNQSSPDAFYSIGGETSCSIYSFSNLCSASPITYGVPNTTGHTYSWSVTGGTPSSTSGNIITVTWNLSGPYSIQLTETNGSCTGSSIPYSLIVTSQPMAQNIA